MILRQTFERELDQYFLCKLVAYSSIYWSQQSFFRWNVMKYVNRLIRNNLMCTVYKPNISLLRQQKTLTSETQRTGTGTFQIIINR